MAPDTLRAVIGVAVGVVVFVAIGYATDQHANEIFMRCWYFAVGAFMEPVTRWMSRVDAMCVRYLDAAKKLKSRRSRK